MAKTIQITRGKTLVVSDEDYESLSKKKIYSDYVDGRWYACLFMDGRKVSVHRHILGEPIGFVVDHKDNDGLNCQRENLRVATRSQNNANRKLESRNKSGYKGVSWSKSNGGWVSCIVSKNKQIYLGTFSDPIDAAKAYDRKAIEIFGVFARVNFPPSDEYMSCR